MQEARRANLQILFDLTSLPLSNSFKRNNYEHFVTRKNNKKNLAFRKLTELNCRSSNLTILYHRNQSCDRSNQSLWDIPWWCFKWQITFDKVEMPRRYFFFSFNWRSQKCKWSYVLTQINSQSSTENVKLDYLRHGVLLATLLDYTWQTLIAS